MDKSYDSQYEKSYEFSSSLPLDLCDCTSPQSLFYAVEETTFSNNVTVQPLEPVIRPQLGPAASETNLSVTEALSGKYCSGEYAYRKMPLDSPEAANYLSDSDMRTYLEWYQQGNVDSLQVKKNYLQRKLSTSGSWIEVVRYLSPSRGANFRRLSFIGRLLRHHEAKVKAQADYEALLKSAQGVQVRTHLEPGEVPCAFVAPVVISGSTVQSSNSRPISPRSLGQDFTLTKAAEVINISPEIDILVQEQLAQLQGVNFETSEKQAQAVGAILESMQQSGELTPVEKKNLLAKGIKIYFGRLVDPVGIVKDQVCFLVNATCFISDITLGGLYLGEDVIIERRQQLREALSALSFENLSQIPSEHWVDLLATIAADFTFGAGIGKTVAFLKEIDALGKASGQCTKLAQVLEQKVSQAGIKVGRYMEDKLAAAAVRGEQVVTIDGIVLNVPPDLSEASVLLNTVKEGTGTGSVIQKVANIGEFFEKFRFGSLLKQQSIKLRQTYKGAQIYKASNKVGDYIKKGYYFYLDTSHYDHLEVFGKHGSVKYVLNFDGSLNKAKTAVALLEGRSITL
jgi:hypothetical protein